MATGTGPASHGTDTGSAARRGIAKGSGGVAFCVVSLMSPVGPEQPGVYWRRRLMVLAAVLLLLIAFWFLFLRGRGSSSATPTPAPTNSSSATSDPTSSPSGSSSPTDSKVPACSDADIAVTIALDGTSFPSGSPVTLTQGIKNNGTEACRRDIGAKANTILITSGGYPVWSSDDCSPGGDSNIVTMKPGDTYQVTVKWKGDVTEGTCPKNPAMAKAGGYDAQGKNGKVVSKTKAFEIT